MQPVPVEGGDGPTYVAATERVIQALCASFQMHRPQSLWNPAASSNFIVCETHPTVGLALCLPKQDPESLPTRKTARALPGTGFMIRAKSDWYWRLGAGKVVAEKAFDGNVMIANEVNHERVAGLYCLAVANAIGHHPASVLICGTKEGNYVFLDHTDESWAADVEGTKAYRDPIARNPSCAVGPTAASPLRTAVGVDPAAELVRHDDRQSECFEDDFDDFEDTVLVLADNGGVWERHNDWLNGHEEIITLVTLDTRRDLLLLCRSQREDGMQWTFVDGRQSPLGVARLRGFQHNHLSLENQCVIPVKVLADGVQVPG